MNAWVYSLYAFNWGERRAAMPEQRREPRRGGSRAPARGALKSPIKVSWRLVQEQPVSPVNIFQVGAVSRPDGVPGEVVLNLGFLPPAPVFGTAEEQLRMAEQLDAIEIQPVARITASRARLEELRQLIAQALEALGGLD
ncbi:MAG TPA: hypothetical protein VNF75_07405 [Candidatus Dormibacteraeota bacterium]|nr:hypothetical protein [Candidatus Dormibacteraeota bacterium]